MRVSKNMLGIKFPKEKSLRYVDQILQYLHYSDSLYYYILFGYGFGDIDIYKYAEIYPEVYDEIGFIKLRKEDITNLELITDFLYEYHTANLYINEYPDLEKKYDIPIMRKNTSLFEGYVVLELTEEYIVIKKDEDLPDWDLEKMGISEDMVY